ncbi:MAG TPA: nucleoside-diphosphate sugar epimerase/dehydratase, partial [Acidobacteriota bacterium]|nr:nucleoside-diphosphate sugar epimerase/dehydratase [Acidobacteriota bacterium]
MNSQIKNPKLYLMIFSDALLFVLAHVLAYLFRFEFSLSQNEIQPVHVALVWLVPLKTAIFFSFGLYKGMWRYTSIWDYWRLAYASLFAMLVSMAVLLYLYRFEGFSRAVFLMDGILTFLLTGGLRLLIRTYFMRDVKLNSPFSVPRQKLKKILIIGAGDAGEKILREIFNNEQLHYQVVGFMDDDTKKHGRSIHGIPVLGPVKILPAILAKHDITELLIAIPSASGEQMRNILDTCKACDVSYKTLPGIGEIIDGRVSVKALRDVNYQDLLGRVPVQLDESGIRYYLKDKNVLITGCGGSIGSELCRHLSRFQPRSLILVDMSEANLFQIQMELIHEHAFRNIQMILGQVQDKALMKDVFLRYRPHVVFHAAAYKHVPMLEINPWEAVSNNILGSRIIMEMAAEHRVERFVLVSTDKAVRPTNVMGASKRVSERLLQWFSCRDTETRFMAVRFGNVVGSSGSVIPLFRRQIELGGPVTVTHPDVTRYFMTIPEAAQLIIQAGALGSGGEIFVLKMGRPVRIAEMAEDLIRLSGKEPHQEIEIIFTGLREGEKLFEELITSGEGIVQT